MSYTVGERTCRAPRVRNRRAKRRRWVHKLCTVPTGGESLDGVHETVFIDTPGVVAVVGFERGEVDLLALVLQDLCCKKVENNNNPRRPFFVSGKAGVLKLVLDRLPGRAGLAARRWTWLFVAFERKDIYVCTQTRQPSRLLPTLGTGPPRLTLLRAEHSIVEIQYGRYTRRIFCCCANLAAMRSLFRSVRASQVTASSVRIS